MSEKAQSLADLEERVPHVKDVAKGLFQSQHLTHTKDLYDPPGKGPEASWVQPGCLSRPRKSHISPTWGCRTPRSLSDGEVTLPGDVIDKECPSCTSVVASRHRPEGMTGASNNRGPSLLPTKTVLPFEPQHRARTRRALSPKQGELC